MNIDMLLFSVWRFSKVPELDVGTEHKSKFKSNLRNLDLKFAPACTSDLMMSKILQQFLKHPFHFS